MVKVAKQNRIRRAKNTETANSNSGLESATSFSSGKGEFRAEDASCFASAVRQLNEYEETIGRLHDVSECEDSLLVTMDQVQFVVDLSMQQLESTSKLLMQYVGKTIGILRIADPVRPLCIRLVMPHRLEASRNRK